MVEKNGESANRNVGHCSKEWEPFGDFYVSPSHETPRHGEETVSQNLAHLSPTEHSGACRLFCELMLTSIVC